MSFILPGGLGQQCSGGGYSAWNTTRAGAGIIFSNNNRTILGPSGGATQPDVAGTAGRSAGQLYFEVKTGTADASSYLSVGIVWTGWTPGTLNQIGGDNFSAGMLSASLWTLYAAGSASYQWNAPANNDTVGVAVNFNVSGQIGVWFRINAQWNNGGTLTTTFPSSAPNFTFATSLAPVFPGSSPSYLAASTLNVGNAAFTNSPPAGYSAWG